MPRLCACLLLLGLAACQPDAPTSASGSATSPAPPAPVELEDVMETGDGYIIGISYPRSVSRYPGLAAELKRYADAARVELMQALQTPAADGGDPMEIGPYDLSLSFVELHASPQLVAVAADGSSYIGGAHGQALVRRFVWLPQHDRLLTAKALIPAAAGWKAVSDHVREQLYGALSLRMDAEALPPDQRGDLMRSAGAMIDAGTEPVPEHFDQFEPVIGAGGRIAALRFVFPPYQVGPYAAGTQTVAVPAAVLLPHVAPEYRELFETGP